MYCSVQLRFVNLLALASVVLHTQVEAFPQAITPSGTCRSVTAAISALQSYSSRSSFCSSWLDLTTQTVTATTTSVVSTQTDYITSTTGTDTFTATTVTSAGHGESVVAHAVSQTVYAHMVTVRAPTPTITAHVSMTTITTISTTLVCGNAKRAESTSRTLPSELSSVGARRTGDFSRACSCLSLPTSTQTVTMTNPVTSSMSTMINVAASTTVTPTVQMTPRSTSVPTITTIITPTTTVTPAPVTTTPISTVVVTSTSTIRVGAAQVLLASPTPLSPLDSNGRAPNSYDDPNPYTLDLPFSVGLYGATTSRLYVYLNGYLGFSNQFDDYRNGALPSSNLPDVAFAMFFDDLFILSGTTQGVFYEITGEAPHRQLSVEYFTSFCCQGQGYTHFIVNLFEDKPGRAVYTFFQTTAGTSGTIGVQRRSTGNFKQYSLNVVPVPGLSIEYNPDTDSFSSYGGTC